MPTVRTTFRPDQDLVVDEREAFGLRQQGLLVEETQDQAPDTDPSAVKDPVDAHEAAKEQNQARREELGEDKSKSRAKSQAKTEGS